MIHFILQKKNLGNFDSDLSLSESELETIDLISKNTDLDKSYKKLSSMIKIIEK